MAALPKPSDPTLIAVASAMEAQAADEVPRPYLGMSAIGDPCSRKLWYGFRWFADQQFDALTLARFADGHHSEDVMAGRLRLVKGIQLQTHEADGNQIGFKDIADHFRGHMDGDIVGLLQAPVTSHVWEHKCVNETKYKVLAKLKDEHGEKQALAKWDPVYYAQAVVYMHYRKRSRHYLTVNTPGSRESLSCRTDADPGYADELIRKAEVIISSSAPPQKISQDAAFYQCKWCPYQDICHRGAEPKKHCRTCKHAAPAEDGAWHCSRYKDDIPLSFQRKGCDEWASAI